MIAAQGFARLRTLVPIFPLIAAAVIWRSPIALAGAVLVIVRTKVSALPPRERFRLKQVWRDRMIGFSASVTICWIFGGSIYPLLAG